MSRVANTKGRGCGDKVRHETRDAAAAHVARLVRSGARIGRLAPYHCRHCGSWHVGHTPRGRR